MLKSDPGRSGLPPLPSIRLRLEKTLPEGSVPPYLRVLRVELSAQFPDGTESEHFRYDMIERRAFDAVVIAPHFFDERGRLTVFLRSAVRPPIALRPREVWPVPERPTLGGLWELPAGLVEVSERSEQGLRECAARELLEEIGANVPASEIVPLGPSTFPSPGVIGERHFYFRARVSPSELSTPCEDGSVLERGASIIPVPLDEALALVRAGEIEDAKTEIGLRRLAEAQL